MLEGSCQFVQHLSQMGGDDHVLADFAGDLDGVQSAYIGIYAGLIISHLRVHLWLLVGGGNLGSCLTVGAAFGCCPVAGSGEVWPFDAGWLTVGASRFMMPVSGSDAGMRVVRWKTADVGFLDGGWISDAGAVQSIL
ncbi:hypothetical protein Nepgr_017424 [Nepenthes gracilis]|uniref:Uncharacterized protein n=1 Tax=Nepenthes gracilis TaxID=150966 RepID=A0AAD3XSG7_NEPGR|nr:hypothetical protein Nepgr_017424 [Nepenthes gracilis]